jgi:hypothetical protein
MIGMPAVNSFCELNVIDYMALALKSCAVKTAFREEMLQSLRRIQDAQAPVRLDEAEATGFAPPQPAARIPAEARSISADVQSQTRHPKLDIAKQLGREIFRPQLALAQKLPFLLRHVRQTVTPHHKPQFHRLVCSHFPIFPIPKRQVLPANDTPIQALEASLLSGAS